jgi:preprotein translocase subunit SecA
VLTTLKVPDDVPIENKRVTGAIASAQAQVESQNFETRKNILKYDDVMSRQREVIYAERRKVLEGADLHEQVRGMIDSVVTGYVSAVTEGFPEEWDLEQLWVALKTLYPVGVTIAQLEEEAGDRSGMSREFLVAELVADAQAAYDRREAELGNEVARELERRVVLSVLDRKWREHLYEMDYLREGIGLRAYSQRDPLVEYQREGFELFTAMMDAITEESVGFLFNLQVQVEPTEPELAPAPAAPESAATEPAPDEQPTVPADEHPDDAAEDTHPRIRAKGLDSPAEPRGLTYTAPTMDGGVGLATTEVSETVDDTSYSGTARNAPCPCGSGRKYKRCHGDPAKRAQLQS